LQRLPLGERIAAAAPEPILINPPPPRSHVDGPGEDAARRGDANIATQDAPPELRDIISVTGWESDAQVPLRDVHFGRRRQDKRLARTGHCLEHRMPSQLADRAD